MVKNQVDTAIEAVLTGTVTNEQLELLIAYFTKARLSGEIDGGVTYRVIELLKEKLK
jgi:hypothetical protein